jgi:folate-binding protein YgfZ
MTQQETVGFTRAPDPAILVLRGDDAGEFLNGQVSNDVANLVDGESRYALLLTPKGKLRADMTIARDGDETLVVTSLEHRQAIVQTIETFRIGYFFSSEDATGEFALIHLLGRQTVPDAAVVPVVELTSPLGVDLLVETTELPALTAALAASGLSELPPESFEAARIAAGIPAFPGELDESTFPAEAGIEQRAISFEKGCYVGQETVARMHYKGKPNRHLRMLRAEAPLTTGAPVVAGDGRELGHVGSVATQNGNATLALAILRREGNPGDTVDAGGTPATIVELAAQDSV